MEIPQQSARHADREEKFVASIIARCQKDKGFAARFRRADNPATEYQSWELLTGYGINLEYEVERLPFATIGAYIAKAKLTANGNLSLGHAIAASYEERRNPDDQAKARLRRLLACNELGELCRILRPLLSLIDTRSGQLLDCVRVLRQLRQFGTAVRRDDDNWKQNIKAQWAQEFYGHKVEVPTVAGGAA